MLKAVLHRTICMMRFIRLFLTLRLERGETLKYRCVCRLPAEKIHIVSNDQGRTHKCNFSVFGWKYPFWVNLFKKKKKNQCQCKLTFGTLANSNIQNSRVILTFCIFDWKIPFLGKLGPKNKNCQFKLKFKT